MRKIFFIVVILGRNYYIFLNICKVRVHILGKKSVGNTIQYYFT